MFRTLIVDDEQLMRQYLERNLSIICPDFYVTGIACDGLEAIELLQKQSFDLVITDIKMPEMDGLNLTKYIFDSALTTKVIIISGYNEFEYARLAIKYGVSDYLLKPLSDEGIHETLTRVKTDLDLETSRKKMLFSINDYQNISNHELKSALLNAFIYNNTDLIQLLYNLLLEKHIKFLKNYSAVMLICLDELYLLLQEKKVYENSSYQLDFYQQIQDYCIRNDYAISFDQNGYALILLTTETEADISIMANAIYMDMIHSHWKHDTIKLLSSYGYLVNDMMSISSSYSSASHALALALKNVPSPITSNYYISQSKYLIELNTICDALYSDYISKNTSKMFSDLYLYIFLFQDDINIAILLRYGTYLIRYLAKKCNIKSDYILSAFNELISEIDQKITSNHFDRESIHALFLRVLKVLDHDDLFVIISESSNIVESAKEFICTHYHEQISLAMVADSLKVNPSYLSDLFHKSIGEPYTKFLTRVRMEQALLLLKSNPNEKIYRIAEKTGFVSAKHFNNVFKKYYGFTPTEYIMKNML